MKGGVYAEYSLSVQRAVLRINDQRNRAFGVAYVHRVSGRDHQSADFFLRKTDRERNDVSVEEMTDGVRNLRRLLSPVVYSWYEV